MISTPTCDRPSREPPPNVHIWPPPPSKKAQNRHFSMERWKAARSPNDCSPPARCKCTALAWSPSISSTTTMSHSTVGLKTGFAMYYSNLIRIRIAQGRGRAASPAAAAHVCETIPRPGKAATALGSSRVAHICDTNRQCFTPSSAILFALFLLTIPDPDSRILKSQLPINPKKAPASH